MSLPTGPDRLALAIKATASLRELILAGPRDTIQGVELFDSDGRYYRLVWAEGECAEFLHTFLDERLEKI